MGFYGYFLIMSICRNIFFVRNDGLIDRFSVLKRDLKLKVEEDLSMLKNEIILSLASYPAEFNERLTVTSQFSVFLIC